MLRNTPKKAWSTDAHRRSQCSWCSQRLSITNMINIYNQCFPKYVLRFLVKLMMAAMIHLCSQDVCPLPDFLRQSFFHACDFKEVCACKKFFLLKTAPWASINFMPKNFQKCSCIAQHWLICINIASAVDCKVFVAGKSIPMLKAIFFTFQLKKLSLQLGPGVF